jgi:hypothetical protein
VNATSCRLEDPIVEAALLVGRELWDSTRARLFEGEAASVLMSSRRSSPGTSDVWITVLAGAGALEEGGPVTVTLASPESTHTGRLDARGCCVILGVPDGRYHIDMCRTLEQDRVPYAAVLFLPVD